MQEPTVRPAPDSPQNKSGSDNLLDDLGTFLVCSVLAGVCLLPLFKVLSPIKNEWTITAVFMTSLLVGFTLFLLVKILNKLNQK